MILYGNFLLTLNPLHHLVNIEVFLVVACLSPKQ